MLGGSCLGRTPQPSWIPQNLLGIGLSSSVSWIGLTLKVQLQYLYGLLMVDFFVLSLPRLVLFDYVQLLGVSTFTGTYICMDAGISRSYSIPVNTGKHIGPTSLVHPKTAGPKLLEFLHPLLRVLLLLRWLSITNYQR